MIVNSHSLAPSMHESQIQRKGIRVLINLLINLNPNQIDTMSQFAVS